MKAIDIPFTVVVGAFRNDNVRMYADADSVSETRNVAVYEIVSTVMGAKDEWSDKDTEVFPILRATRFFDGFRHVYFLGEDPTDNPGYFNYQRMDVMAEICMKLHELGSVE